MERRSVFMTKKWCFLLLCVFLYGCAAQVNVEEYRKEWVTRPWSELKQEIAGPGSYASKTGWKEKTYPLANGNLVHIEPLSKDCFIHWEVNPKGIIVGFKAEGSGCEQEPNTGADMIRKITAPPPPGMW